MKFQQNFASHKKLIKQNLRPLIIKRILLMNLFNDQAVWREHNQWKAIFAQIECTDDDSQILANFGSKTEDSIPQIDTEMEIDEISEALASDVFRNIQPFFVSDRSVHTASGARAPTKPLTANQKRRIRTNHGNVVPKGRMTPSHQIPINYSKAKLGNLQT